MRRTRVKKREVTEDLLYKNRLVAKFINCSMRAGKKSVAARQVYSALEKVGRDSKEDPLKVFLKALQQVKPSQEVRPRRIGGAAYQVPMPVRGQRRETLAIRWLISAANARSNAQYKTYANKLAAEILDAAKGEGGAVGRKQEMEKMAESNKAFAHFRW